jgi:RNA polymerase sigma factor (sigma-70 family)
MAEKQRDLERIVLEQRPSLRSFIRRRVNNEEDAEDILQDVFYQLTKALNETLNPIEQVSAWLYRVARNLIINHGKRMREEALPVYYDEDGEEETADRFLPDDAPTPEDAYFHAFVMDELEQALSELPAEQREAFVLTELDGLPVKEVAEAAEVPLNTLLSRKHYAVLYLRKRLRSLYEELCRPN